jgi:hypothetical protein
MGSAEPTEVNVRIGSRDARRVRVAATISLRQGEGNCIALLHDLSVTGARIETQSARLKIGEIVHLNLPSLPAERRAKVAWTAGASAGVQFSSSLDRETFHSLSRALQRTDAVIDLPVRRHSAAVPHARREVEAEGRRKRAEVAIAANCRPEKGQRGFVVMVDLTPEGCCLFRRDIELNVGQKITLQPECLTAFSATIQWSQGHLAGVRFENPLYPAMFEHLAKTYPWPLPEAPKRSLAPHAHIPEGVQRELTRMIARAEDAFRNRVASRDVLTTRPPIIGSRPGIGSRGTDGKLARLFLG